jgi:pyruvate formate lyase activating enzyme
MKRRTFIRAAAGAGLSFGAGLAPLRPGPPSFPSAIRSGSDLSHVEARYYRKLPDREIECELCPRRCRLGDKERGYCGVRENIGGTYYTLVYGKPCSLHVDPIEKKPFFHFLPGTNALSLATAGCNVNCKFCQNWEISQVRPEQVDHLDLPPADVSKLSLEYRCPSIAYTYTEPVVFFEYMTDSAVEARKRKIRNVVVTGGHILQEPLEELLDSVDAVKIDLKAFSQDFYASYVRGELKPVLDAIRKVGRSRVWLEVVYLVIPTLNDDVREIREMSRWLLGEVGPDVPLHFSRFIPMYLMKNFPPTPLSTLETAHGVARDEGLHFVYVGNVPGHPGENTYCPSCREVVVRRTGYLVEEIRLKGNLCANCRSPIPGVWA